MKRRRGEAGEFEEEGVRPGTLDHRTK